MNNKRKGLFFILAAVLCGFIVMGSVYMLAKRTEPSVPALRAVQDINAGDPLNEKMFETVKLAKTDAPVDLIKPGTDFSTLVAAKSLAKHDILRKAAVMDLQKPDPGLFSSRLRALKDPNLRAIEIPTEAVKGLLSGMGNNDHIDIIAVYKEVPQSVSGALSSDKEVLTSKTIVTDVPVIGVKSDSGNNESVTSESATILVVAVTPEQAEKVALYREKGKIYGALRPFGASSEAAEAEKTQSPVNEAPVGQPAVTQQQPDQPVSNIDSQPMGQGNQ